jgi:hypothetical protein
VGLVLVRAMLIIVPLIAAFALSAISFLAMVLDPVTHVSGTNDVPQVLSTLTLVVLIRRERYAAGRVPTRALVMVEVLTLSPVSLLKG